MTADATPRRLYLFLAFFLLLALETSCSPQGNLANTLPVEIATITAESTSAPVLSSSPTPLATATPAPTTTPSPSPTASPSCSPELCVYSGHFWLERPISPEDNDILDFTYRYGSTQLGNRPTHRGVEFVNPEGTAVLAAAKGKVVVAGDDAQQAYADFPLYYGYLVVIEHQMPELESPVYTLYGHLSEVLTEVGADVQAGDLIGRVGYTGIAEWSHLHLEVRVGENRFTHTRNPELWLKPHSNAAGVANGALAGRILDEFGSPIYIPNVVIERLGEDNQEILETIYVETYADFSVHGDDVWSENFGIGDLPPGMYRVSFVARGLQVWEVMVYPGQLTLLTFDAGEK